MDGWMDGEVPVAVPVLEVQRVFRKLGLTMAVMDCWPRTEDWMQFGFCGFEASSASFVDIMPVAPPSCTGILFQCCLWLHTSRYWNHTTSDPYLLSPSNRPVITRQPAPPYPPKLSSRLPAPPPVPSSSFTNL